LGRRLVGRWTAEATHPGLLGAIVFGSSEIDWLEGERFPIYRSSCDHPDIPDSISIIGDTDGRVSRRVLQCPSVLNFEGRRVLGVLLCPAGSADA
jgi:hypothetical protein